MSVERLNIYTCDRCGHQEKVRRAITAGKERHPAGWARMTLDYIDGPGLAQWAVCITCRIELAAPRPSTGRDGYCRGCSDGPADHYTHGGRWFCRFCPCDLDGSAA